MKPTLEKIKLNELADAVITELKRVNEPFVSPILVFHNSKISQWFKAYYLKNNPEVLMNVRFQTLSVFINDIVNPGREHKIIGVHELRDYIVKILLDRYAIDTANPSNPINYIFNGDGSINGINLYEFSNQLANLFMNYEYDSEDLATFEPNKAWEATLYKEVIAEAEKEDCYTTKSLFEKDKNEGKIAMVRDILTDPVYIIDNSYITALYDEILDELNSPNVKLYSLENSTDSCTCEEVFAAPSILREVEAIHSRICNIIQNDPAIRFNDIVVYAPNIKDYTNTIHQVFKQDDKDFPAIPYRIVGECKDQENMVGSLSLLFDIANKHFFTRYDLNNFIKNPIIKHVWEITDSDVNAWMGAVVTTNTYRNGKETDDWDYLKKRLLLSSIVSEDSSLEAKTEIAGKEYLPFKSIDLDDASLNKLIDVIDALMNWCKFFTKELNDILLDKTALDNLTSILDGLYSKKGTDGEETNYLYKPVYQQNERFKALNANIPANTWMLLLLDSPNRHVSHPADMFVKGVTFLGINSDDIVYEPYSFVMGLSSEQFPRVQVKSELDASKKHTPSEELDKVSLSHICFNAERCVCSYVNRDLKKDSEHYPSSLIPKGKMTSKIPLDEVRDYDQLFTKKEFVSKEYQKGLLSGGSSSKFVKRAISSKPNPEESLHLTDLKFYLENTYAYKFNHLLNRSDYDVDENTIRIGYEPIDEDALVRYAVIKDIIKSNGSAISDREKTVLERTLPEKGLGDLYYDQYSTLAGIIKNVILTQNYKYSQLDPLMMCANVNGDAIKWILNCNADMFSKEENGEYYYIEPVDYKPNVKEKDIGISYYFNAYVFALMDIAGKNIQDECIIHLNEIAPRGIQFSLNSAEAKAILNQLYENMTDYADTRLMNSVLIKAIADNDEDPDSFPKTLAEFYPFIGDYSEDTKWKYLENKRMINPFEAFGYTDQNIRLEIEEEYKKVRSCIKFI